MLSEMEFSQWLNQPQHFGQIKKMAAGIQKRLAVANLRLPGTDAGCHPHRCGDYHPGPDGTDPVCGPNGHRSHRLHQLGIPQDRITKRLGVPPQTISRYLPKMLEFTKWVNTDLSKGFTVPQVAQKHGWPDSLV
jgi:hypothetical protein